MTAAPSPPVEDLFAAALAQHRAGRLDQAERLYRQILQADPRHADSLHLLGVIAHQVGRHDVAAGLIRQAIAIAPMRPAYHSNLGGALNELARFEDAESCCRKALVLAPDFADAMNNLGGASQKLGRLPAALGCYRRTACLQPAHAEALNNLGHVLERLGHFAEAAVCGRRAIALDPARAAAHNNLGNALEGLGRRPEAAGSYRRALALRPDQAKAYNNLGNLLHELGQLEPAFGCARGAVLLEPDFAEAYSNLGNVLKDLGRTDAAIGAYHRALAIRPGFSDAHSNLLFALNYHPTLSGEAIFAEYRRWDAAHVRPLLPAVVAFDNSPDPERRLRIGYVSGDFRRHSVRHFIEPVLANHDRAQVEVLVYAEVPREDEVTARFKGMADRWTSTVGMTDEEVAARIRADGIDVLVDLAGHTAGNRLLVFARKPAPIQVSWLGYACTTGLSAMDYYLADPVLAPPGCEHLFSEKLVRLPVFAAYRPAEGMGEPGPLPALAGRGVTFGCLSRSIRINHRVVGVWAELLKRLPAARLVIDSLNYRDPAVRREMAGRFAAHGVAPERLDLGYTSPPWDVLRGIDIGLDCFPHNSGTTLYETLQMGVPFVTLAGRPSVGRLGASILTAVGHPEWIAASEEEYVEPAVELATDLPRLAGLRAGLRAEMEAGPLRDEIGFARAIEAAYRRMWRDWKEAAQ